MKNIINKGFAAAITTKSIAMCWSEGKNWPNDFNFMRHSRVSFKWTFFFSPLHLSGLNVAERKVQTKNWHTKKISSIFIQNNLIGRKIQIFGGHLICTRVCSIPFVRGKSHQSVRISVLYEKKKKLAWTSMREYHHYNHMQNPNTIKANLPADIDSLAWFPHSKRFHYTHICSLSISLCAFPFGKQDRKNNNTLISTPKNICTTSKRASKRWFEAKAASWYPNRAYQYIIGCFRCPSRHHICAPLISWFHVKSAKPFFLSLINCQTKCENCEFIGIVSYFMSYAMAFHFTFLPILFSLSLTLTISILFLFGLFLLLFLA